MIWPFTFFIEGSELLYKTYKQSWRYLGSIGRYAVDFFVVCALLVAANEYDEKRSAPEGWIYGTLGGYIVLQGTVSGLSHHYMHNAMLNLELKSFPVEPEPVEEKKPKFEVLNVFDF